MLVLLMCSNRHPVLLRRMTSNDVVHPRHASSYTTVIGPSVTLRRKHNRSQSSTMWLERQRKDPYVAKAQNQGLPSRSYFKLKEINEYHYPSLRAKTKQDKKKLESNNIRTANATSQECKTLIQPGSLVLDLGAAPGGWSLYASTQLRRNLGGAVVAVDLLSLNDTLHSSNNTADTSSKLRANLQSNFCFIQGDFTKLETRTRIMDAFANVSSGLEIDPIQSIETDAISSCRRPYLVLSDMSANFTGDSLTDAIRTINLCEEALAFAAGSQCFDPSSSSTTHDPSRRCGILEDGGAFLCKYFSCGKEHEADLRNATKRAFRSVHAIKPSASRKESSEMYLLALDYNCK
jgi:23S rRNA (uridine2552-2'-O)-methyltransferase